MENGAHAQRAVARELGNERDSVFSQTAGMEWNVWDLRRTHKHAPLQVRHVVM